MEQRVEQIQIEERPALGCAHCLDTQYICLTCEEDGEEFEIIVKCRRCGGVEK